MMEESANSVVITNDYHNINDANSVIMNSTSQKSNGVDGNDEGIQYIQNERSQEVQSEGDNYVNGIQSEEESESDNGIQSDEGDNGIQSDEESEGDNDVVEQNEDDEETWDSRFETEKEDSDIGDEFFEPLYSGANVTVCGAYCAIMHLKSTCRLPFSTLS